LLDYFAPHKKYFIGVIFQRIHNNKSSHIILPQTTHMESLLRGHSLLMLIYTDYLLGQKHSTHFHSKDIKKRENDEPLLKKIKLVRDI